VNATFLAGVLSAWTAAHLGLALFFALAYAVGRRETEYLLFSLLCAAFSVLTGGVASDVVASTLHERMLADQVTHTGAILAAVLNLHFALCFAASRRSYAVLVPLYAAALFFTVGNWLGWFWVPGSYRTLPAFAFGIRAQHAIGQVTPIGWAYYGVAASQAMAALALLVYAYRKGRREALASLFGAVVIVAAIVNDIGLALRLSANTLPLLPHVFLVYAFGAAGSLLWRYRVVRGELEVTASSLRQRTEELRHSHAELAQVQSELLTKKQLAAVGELAAAIAHEVRNPLAIIVNAVAGLRRSELGEENREILLNIVDEEAGRLNRLVTDLLRFARPVRVKRSPVSLVELARRCRVIASDGYDIAVSAADDPSVHTVYVDPNLFRLVFDNLVANACQAMPNGGAVQIRIDRAELRGEPAARIEFKDEGHGMEPEVLQRALDPFFTTRPSGTGLGLPIVQRIVEAHAGELSLESDDGGGARITILVPLGEPDDMRQLEERVA
jgi:signal transduction histidine kinase